jgi:hypothetical protein
MRALERQTPNALKGKRVRERRRRRRRRILASLYIPIIFSLLNIFIIYSHKSTCSARNILSYVTLFRRKPLNWNPSHVYRNLDVLIISQL